MNIFAKKEADQLTAKNFRIVIADVPVEVFKLYERVYHFNRRLEAIAGSLGGPYPMPSHNLGEPPIEICSRIGFDISNAQNALDDMALHISKLEALFGFELSQEQAQESSGVEIQPKSTTIGSTVEYDFESGEYRKSSS